MWEFLYNLFVSPLWLLHFILLAIFWVLTITGIYITIAYYIKKWKNRNAPKVEIDDYYNY